MRQNRVFESLKVQIAENFAIIFELVPCFTCAGPLYSATSSNSQPAFVC